MRAEDPLKIGQSERKRKKEGKRRKEKTTINKTNNLLFSFLFFYNHFFLVFAKGSLLVSTLPTCGTSLKVQEKIYSFFFLSFRFLFFFSFRKTMPCTTSNSSSSLSSSFSYHLLRSWFVWTFRQPWRVRREANRERVMRVHCSTSKSTRLRRSPSRWYWLSKRGPHLSKKKVAG